MVKSNFNTALPIMAAKPLNLLPSSASVGDKREDEEKGMRMKNGLMKEFQQDSQHYTRTAFIWGVIFNN